MIQYILTDCVVCLLKNHFNNKVYNQSGFILLTQTKYIKDILAKVNMDNVNGVNTPLFSQWKLSKHDTNTMVDHSLYMSIVGALKYFKLTRVNIAYYVNDFC